MNKRAGLLFDVMLIILIILGMTVVIGLFINLWGGFISDDLQERCIDTCLHYDMYYHDIDNLLGECWCDDEGLPRQMPLLEKENKSILERSVSDWLE